MFTDLKLMIFITPTMVNYLDMKDMEKIQHQEKNGFKLQKQKPNFYFNWKTKSYFLPWVIKLIVQKHFKTLIFLNLDLSKLGKLLMLMEMELKIMSIELSGSLTDSISRTIFSHLKISTILIMVISQDMFKENGMRSNMLLKTHTQLQKETGTDMEIE